MPLVRSIAPSPPRARGDGLILRAAGEVDGRWKAVSIWESKDAFERFAEERILPAVKEALGDGMAAGPPPTEWFEAKHMIGP